MLEGANPSAEGEDAEEGGDSETQRVLDIEDQFRLVKIEGVSKKSYTSELKSTTPFHKYFNSGLTYIF